MAKYRSKQARLDSRINELKISKALVMQVKQLEMNIINGANEPSSEEEQMFVEEN